MWKTVNIVGTHTNFAAQIYETQLNELSSQTQSLAKDVGAKDDLLQEARETINVKVWRLILAVRLV